VGFESDGHKYVDLVERLAEAGWPCVSVDEILLFEEVPQMEYLICSR